MSRDRIADAQDHVVVPEAQPERLFRIYAVEPHGWSTVLIEDEGKRIFLCSTTAAALTEVSAADAQALLLNRSYRRWFGSSEWAPLSQLPLVSATFSRPTADHAESSSL